MPQPRPPRKREGDAGRSERPKEPTFGHERFVSRIRKGRDVQEPLAPPVAGLPRLVIDRAQTILHDLEFGRSPAHSAAPPPDRRVRVKADEGMIQLSLFDGIDHPVLERLRGIDANALTPLEALRILGELADEAR